MKVLKQSIYESCLACCLMMLTELPYSQKTEILIWQRGWNFNYLRGQLDYVANVAGKMFKVYIEDKYYFKQLQKEKSKSIELANEKIGKQLLKKLLEDGHVIVYLDNYYLQHILHAPHFVLALRGKGNTVKVADPYDGKVKKVPSTLMNKAIISLRNHLKFSPALIIFSGNK